MTGLLKNELYFIQREEVKKLLKAFSSLKPIWHFISFLAPLHIYNANFFLEPLNVARNVCLVLPLWSHWNNWTTFSACQLFFIVCDTLLITFYLNLLSIFFFTLKVPFGFYLFQIPGSILTFKDNETIEPYSKLLW